ncbi:Multicopper oxidase [Ceratobasidium sp. AG-Ba]|nr:Multicopper oxidase [Ceratobasidium sp. AG-Ba]
MRGSALSLSLFAVSARLAAAQTFADHTLNIVNARISPDGFSRTASLVNGKFPGTTIFANKGEIIRNTVINQLNDSSMRQSTTIHWHGLFQRTTAYEDGPAFVTQCPISPGYSYQYVIPTFNQAGTHWYHSHLGSQYVDGVRGAVVIYDPNDPHKSLYDVDNESTIIQLSDWYHKPAPALTEEYFKSGKEPIPDAGLINGRGRYVGGPAVPWTVFNVEKGKRYRYRVLNNNALGFFKFEMDGHPFTIIEADGVAHQPVTVKSVIIHPGERYSIIVHANQTVGNYWVRAPLDTRRGGVLDCKAILRYVGAPAVDPTTSQVSGNTLNVAQLRPLENPGAPGGSRRADVIIDLKYGGVSGGRTGWQVNESQYKSPSLPTLLKILSNNATTNNDFARSENTIVLPHNKVIELILHGSSNGFEHPWHLHGHAFDVVQTDGGPVNYVNPPRKDVIAVGGGTVRIQFKSDNPGPWFLHCHVDWHLEAGLAVVFAEAPSEQRATIRPSPGWSELCPRYAALPASKQ